MTCLFKRKPSISMGRPTALSESTASTMAYGIAPIPTDMSC